MGIYEFLESNKDMECQFVHEGELKTYRTYLLVVQLREHPWDINQEDL